MLVVILQETKRSVSYKEEMSCAHQGHCLGGGCGGEIFYVMEKAKIWHDIFGFSTLFSVFLQYRSLEACTCTTAFFPWVLEKSKNFALKYKLLGRDVDGIFLVLTEVLTCPQPYKYCARAPVLGQLA